MEENLLKIGFDKNEAYFFSHLYRKLDDEDKKFLADLGAEYASGKGNNTANDVQARLKFLSEKYAANEKTIDMLFFISNFDLMKETAERAAKEYDVEFLFRDFRPYFRAGQEKARELGFYMQKYCGCVFSEEERYIKSKKIIR